MPMLGPLCNGHVAVVCDWQHSSTCQEGYVYAAQQYIMGITVGTAL
jgi:hypothetical protein